MSSRSCSRRSATRQLISLSWPLGRSHRNVSHVHVAISLRVADGFRAMNSLIAATSAAEKNRPQTVAAHSSLLMHSRAFSHAVWFNVRRDSLRKAPKCVQRIFWRFSAGPWRAPRGREMWVTVSIPEEGEIRAPRARNDKVDVPVSVEVPTGE
jgi:hypothetical protein